MNRQQNRKYDPQSSKNRFRRRRRLLVAPERLEHRRLMAAGLQLAENTLYVTGDDSDNHAEIRTVGDRLQAEISSPAGSHVGEYPLADVHRVVFNGYAGNDTLIHGSSVPLLAWAHDGNDRIVGGTGNDQIAGGNGHDEIDGGEGRDLMWGEGGNDVLIGGSGNDDLIAGSGDDLILAGPGNDRAWAESGNDSLVGGDGHDELSGGTGDDRLDGGSGNDSIWGGDGRDQLFGESGSDDLVGGDGDDVIAGATGNDRIWAAAGNDIVVAGVGNDLVFGGSGNDQIFGGGGDDSLYGENDHDKIFGDGGNDHVDGGWGNDVLEGGRGDDQLHGLAGRDVISGDDGRDFLYGGDDADQMFGGDGRDYLDGQSGDDLLSGNRDNDALLGSSGNDRIYGGQGQDILAGGDGNDVLQGGSDGWSSESIRGDGTVHDFFFAGAGNNSVYDWSWSNGPSKPAAHTGLSESQLNRLASAALQNWRRAGLDTSMMQVEYRIADLPGRALGWTIGSSDGSAVILIDSDAGGHGWFVDATPTDHAEFTGVSAIVGIHPDLARQNRFDLMTVIQHEQGHAAGLIHTPWVSVMTSELLPGTRILPDSLLASLAPGKTQAAFVDAQQTPLWNEIVIGTNQLANVAASNASVWSTGLPISNLRQNHLIGAGFGDIAHLPAASSAVAQQVIFNPHVNAYIAGNQTGYGFSPIMHAQFLDYMNFMNPGRGATNMNLAPAAQVGGVTDIFAMLGWSGLTNHMGDGATRAVNRMFGGGAIGHQPAESYTYSGWLPGVGNTINDFFVGLF